MNVLQKSTKRLVKKAKQGNKNRIQNIENNGNLFSNIGNLSFQRITFACSVLKASDNNFLNYT